MVEGKYFLWEVEGSVAIVEMRYFSTIDYSEYPEIESELLRIAEAEGVVHVLLRLQALENFSSRMMGVLVAMSKKVGPSGIMAVCRLRPEPLKMYKLCRLDKFIPCFATEEEARTALGGA